MGHRNKNTLKTTNIIGIDMSDRSVMKISICESENNSTSLLKGILDSTLYTKQLNVRVRTSSQIFDHRLVQYFYHAI